MMKKAFFILAVVFSTVFEVQTANRPSFSAHFQKQIVQFKKESNVVFDQVESNMPGCYNTETGVFTAPADGTYFFSWTVLKLTAVPLHLLLRVNGRRSFTSFATGARQGEPLVGSRIVTLKFGDKVYLFVEKGHVKLYGTHHSFFSGYQL